MTEYSEDQYVFWDIFDRVSVAQHAHSVATFRWIELLSRHGENTPEVDAAALAVKDSIGPLLAAEDEFAAFRADHPGEEFLVFRSERIRAAISADIQPLNLPRFEAPS